MLGSDSLIPGRFLTIISHICVVATLLWQSQEITQSCLPNPLIQDQKENHSQIYHNRLVVGFAMSLTFSIAELVVFMSGLTMFHPSLSLLSVGCHGVASVALTDFALAGWLCHWYWWVFAFCDIIPLMANVFVATIALICGRNSY